MKQKTTFKNLTAVNDNWRSWIAENLMLGVQPDAIAGVLTQNGVPPLAARGEVEAALRSPYLRGVTRLANRVAKRDWVLGIQARLDRMGDSATPAVPRKDKLSGEDFFRQHYLTNRPVIITGMLDHFPALRKWNLDYFAERLGERMVEVQFGRDADPHYELNSIAHKRQIAFGEYVKLIRESGSSNDFYMTANNDTRNRESLKELWGDVGTLPAYLADDPERRGFFWFGPAGTITPLHHDLTNNFMAQIMGRKRVRLIAPSELASVYNHRHCFTDVDARAPDLQRFPAMAGVPIHDCVLEPGEILFLPVGWWHHVEALDIAVTLAYTNFRWPNDFFSNYPAHHDF